MLVLIIGGAGMLGHKLTQTLRARGHEVVPTLRGLIPPGIPLFAEGRTLEHIDAADEPALARAMTTFRPQVVVNAVGVIKQRGAAKEAIPSIRINALLPHVLAAHTETIGARLIHFSTDCVFDGQQGRYTEESPLDAQDLYGRSKALGEVRDAPHALTLRTSIIGRELANFASLVEWFLAQDGRPVRGFRRAIYSGLTTNRMASLVAQLIEERPDLAGLWHVASPPINKYDLLLKLQAAYGTGAEITPDDEFVLDRSLDATRFWTETGWTPPTWEEMIAEMVAGLETSRLLVLRTGLLKNRG
ncbi:MAG: NAD(P)-dependent oxidoreductase, partial [Armatimonadota bacterium]